MFTTDSAHFYTEYLNGNVLNGSSLTSVVDRDVPSNSDGAYSLSLLDGTFIFVLRLDGCFGFLAELNRQGTTAESKRDYPLHGAWITD